MSDTQADEPSESSEQQEPDRPPRYGFGAFVRDGWQVFRRDPQRLIAVFCGLHVVAALIPFVFFFEVSDDAARPLIFFARVIIPVIVGSIAVGIGSRILSDPDDDSPIDIDAVDRPADEPSGARAMDLLALSLIAAMLSVVGVLMLGAYGILILHMFYGPPIAMQAAVLERKPFREAITRARSLLRGNWRLILYMLNLAVLIGILILVVIGPLYGLLPEEFHVAKSLAVSVVHGIFVGVLTSYLAAVQVSLYDHLRALPAAEDSGDSGAGVELPAGVDRAEAASDPH